MVLRDHDGLFLGRTARFSGKVIVLEAEAVGMREALIWANELPCQPIILIIVESDSQLVINALQRNKLNHLEVGIVLEECQAVL